MEAVSRRNEGLLLVRQDNNEGSITVHGINDTLQSLIGYSEKEAQGEPLTMFVSDNIVEVINDYLEFESAEQDFQDVMAKTRNLRLLHKNGEEIPCQFKIMRTVSHDSSHWFRILIEDERQRREAREFSKVIADNFKGHEILDVETGLPDGASLAKDLELAQFYVATKDLRACFAAVRVDNFSTFEAAYGRRVAVQALNQAGASLRRNLRADDTIGRLTDDMLGLILMDIEMDSARVVLNRLRWSVTAEPLSITEAGTQKMTVSICIAALPGEGAEALASLCTEKLNDTKEIHALVEVKVKK